MLLLKCIGVYLIYDLKTFIWNFYLCAWIRVTITISRPEAKNVEIPILKGKKPWYRKSKAYNFNFFC